MLAACCGNDVQIWSVPKLEPIATLKGHNGSINALAFSSDGLALASIGRDSEIRLWEVATGRLKLVFGTKSANNGLRESGFNPDGRTLASGGGSPELWSVATGRRLLQLSQRPRHSLAPIFSPDGSILVIGGNQLGPEMAPVELYRVQSLAEIDAAERAEAEAK